MRERRGAWRTATLALAALSACAVPTGTKTESELLPHPAAKIELVEVSNATGQEFDVDAPALLRAAMEEALRDEDLAASPGFVEDRFVLSLAITDYRPGNAFKRWLLPGYGSTVLAVRGTLRDAATGGLAASVVHRRSVLAGGAYTIGAWKTIFRSVAGDLAADLRVRIEQGGEFVVAVAPRAEQETAPAPREDAPRIRIASVADERPERGRIGERKAAFGVAMGDVHLARRVPELVREALTDDLLAGGHRVVESGEDLSVDAWVRRFWVHTDTTPLYWDVVGEIELELAVAAPGAAPVHRTFACRQADRTYAWPTAALTGRVLDRCLAELGEKVRTDPVWRP